MREYIIDGVPLRDPAGQWWIDYTDSDLSGSAARAITGSQPWGYHGEPAPAEGFFSTSQENIKLNLVGSDKDNFNALLRSWQGLLGKPTFRVLAAPQRTALASGSQRYGQAFSGPTAAVRQALGRKVGSIAVERHDEAAATLTIIWENLSAFWRSADLYDSAPLALSAGQVDYDLDAWLLDSTAPVTDALVRIKGPLAAGGYVQLRDRDTSRGVRYNATTALLGTEWLLLDTATLRAVVQTSASWDMSVGTDVSGRVDVSGSGLMSFSPGTVQAFPAGFDWFARVNAAGYTSGTTTVELRARRSYTS